MSSKNRHRFGLTQRTSPTDEKPDGMSAKTVILIALLFSVIGFALPAIAVRNVEGPAAEEATYSTIKSQDRLAASGTNGISEQEYLEAFVWLARGKLEDLQIHHTLKVSHGEHREIVISGVLSTNDIGRYELFKSWFNAQERFPVLRDQIAESDIFSSVPNVKSVWLGEVSVAYFDDGSSARIGEEIGDGWQVIKIGTSAIRLHKDGTIIALQY